MTTTMDPATLTPYLAALHELLAGGTPCTRDDIRRHLKDQFLGNENIANLISRLRKAVAPAGLLVVCNHNGRATPTYQLVRRITPGE